MMIINFLPISSGGGLQNALSFINELSEKSPKSCVFIVRQNSLIEQAALKKNFEVLSVKKGLFNRVKFELTARSLFMKQDVCFTFFGPPILSLIRYTHNINGFAYSNLLYPNLDFWWFQSWHKRARSKLIDWYRKHSMSFADEIIYETKVLKDRALIDPILKNVKSHVVKMAASSLVGLDKVDHLDSNFDEIKNLVGFKLLFLAGAQPNKRIKEFLQTLAILNHQSDHKFFIILTMNSESSYYHSIKKHAIQLGVLEFVVNLQTILPNDVSTLIHHCDAMVNVALLESFSNNFIEAWSMNKPLIVSDSDWANESCGSAALYIDIGKPDKVAKKIYQLLSDPKQQIQNGILELEAFPTAKQKTLNYMKIIEDVS
jgi:glycosyltransferase involved in cell wall biosynthesis